MTANKEELSDWIEDIVAFHKTRRKFVTLKDMESEDADQFLICELKEMILRYCLTDFQKLCVFKRRNGGTASNLSIWIFAYQMLKQMTS
jgi:hypothetical protein